MTVGISSSRVQLSTMPRLSAAQALQLQNVEPAMDRIERSASLPARTKPNVATLAAFVSAATVRSAIADKSRLENVVIVPSGDVSEDLKLRDAVQWLYERYPRFFPLQKSEIGIRNPGKGCDGFTHPTDGSIDIRAGMSPENVAGTLAHEMLHSRVGSQASRLKQGVDELFRSKEEHDFLSALDQVVTGHARLEMKQGHTIDNAELMLRQPSLGVIEFEERGAPTMVRKISLLPEGTELETRLPHWSAVRASFERESR